MVFGLEEEFAGFSGIKRSIDILAGHRTLYSDEKTKFKIETDANKEIEFVTPELYFILSDSNYINNLNYKKKICYYISRLLLDTLRSLVTNSKAKKLSSIAYAINNKYGINLVSESWLENYQKTATTTSIFENDLDIKNKHGGSGQVNLSVNKNELLREAKKNINKNTYLAPSDDNIINLLFETKIEEIDNLAESFLYNYCGKFLIDKQYKNITRIKNRYNRVWFKVSIQGLLAIFYSEELLTWLKGIVIEKLNKELTIYHNLEYDDKLKCKICCMLYENLIEYLTYIESCSDFETTDLIRVANETLNNAYELRENYDSRTYLINFIKKYNPQKEYKEKKIREKKSSGYFGYIPISARHDTCLEINMYNNEPHTVLEFRK